MKKKVTTTDEDIKISLKKKETEQPAYTTDEEIDIKWTYNDEHVTPHPKEYEEIDY
ncbi:hypothetical protein GFC29_3673 [Anoxybacillus sp. B7M1]|jgi:hypothetical protein|uniref:Uncharacterized protein n=1 Tax=Anoxybacteroides rupiense TaxID=311460 RepID=A0ABD5IUC4_9BACL|nr:MULTISPECIES: hypothetical protein [Anoxybacillus]ANB56667.1 hypothetical protein GFC28_1761 [Anoxybacillus sp. B2M1]ANB63802.1 hypothetical protein GFC29_3673 [Anoxybacillus sp. B7M1]KXG10214.1 hypothetical protein AT864_01775 [Anoxybacillus sp. P3H1B]MBB3907439.1 hypothetical protein [Anoxybacillus rupiensis]MBS2770442.1 hypothetical protein [Anoxybacillus rupiensis]